ncbi:MAG: outer membrane protein transport protein [Myxococcales bacterium]
MKFAGCLGGGGVDGKGTGRSLRGWLAGLALSLISASVQAQGFVTDRGVRALGRGTAFVAGAEGAEALWYNPAGLAYAGRSLRLEGTLGLNSASFRRVDEAASYQYPSVSEGTTLNVVPLLGYTENFGLSDFTFGLAAFGQNTRQHDWPTTVMSTVPAPQRYAGFESSQQQWHAALGMAWHGVRGLSLGIAPQLVLGRWKRTLDVSQCDSFACTYPEDPNFDSRTQLGPVVLPAVTVGLGLTYLARYVRVGASLQTPFRSSGKADVSMQLPTAPLYDRASIGAGTVDAQLSLPWIARAGIEFLPVEGLRIELAGTFERWSKRPGWQMTSPSTALVSNVVGIGDYQAAWSAAMPMQDSFSARLGAEYRIFPAHLSLRAGAAYMSSSVPTQALTAVHYDANRVLYSLGASVHIQDRADIDGVVGYVLQLDQDVSDSEVVQPSANLVPGIANNGIGNGHYHANAVFLGLGATIRL